MKKRQKEWLVRRKDLEGVIDGIKDLAPYQDFLKTRWIGMVMWWHERSVDARWKYFSLRAIIIVGGVLLPVLSAIALSGDYAPYASITISVVGAIIAASAAWEGVANYGEIWREKRRAAELLKAEGWQFLQLCGKYRDEGTDTNAQKYKRAFTRFAAEVEGLIAKEVGEYLAFFDESVAQAKEEATGVATDTN